MKTLAVDRARERLDSAQRAIASMNEAQQFSELKRSWWTFLNEANGVYEKLRIGSRGCQVSEPWFGRVKSDRKKDELLNYVHKARNAEEHGLDPSITHAYHVEVTSGVRIEVTAIPQSNGDIFFFQDGDPMRPYLFRLTGALVAVTDSRYQNTFPPPTKHLGKELREVTAYLAAQLTTQYLSALVERAASELPAH